MPSQTTPKSRVVKAIDELFVHLEADAVYRHWAENFRQHSPLVSDGREGLRTTIVQLGTLGFKYEMIRVLADGPWVVLHAHGGGVSQPFAVFNLLRVENDRLAEHWEVVQAQVTETASGHGVLDGPTEITDLDRTDDNRELIRSLFDKVLVGGDLGALAGYFDGDTLVQHSPDVADGVSALRGWLESGPRRYEKLDLLIADGNFVWAQSAGTVDGRPYVLNDLFRIADGKIVEHWDVIGEVPAQLPHENSLFATF
ncbi:nuclear transport factor 2 family protein [Streptomyces beihaiensis]|uniref:Nuclear transport factor 2 family protein n=1 Tax=Streptomyces beihaiensis TaxID=2984495 RepID=A0ABT3TU49_9ACTN|nr:nuclear transport factor 2 family protein [Streptomyces beihaiensis]MCX3060315.1 nuclear transport factor 2 family protein [Streptomyces beihaiensis]